MKGTTFFSICIISLILLTGCATCAVVNTAITPTNPSATIVQTSTAAPTQQTTEQIRLVEPADIIFYNGNIITIEISQPIVQAVAIHDNLIQAVGSNKEILAFQGPDTVVIDLKGKTLMPGFVEGHTHYTHNGWEDGIPLETMMQNMLSFGLTSITEMHSMDEYIKAMLKAERNEEIDVRMNIFGEYNCGSLENGKSIECISWYRSNPPILDPTHMVRIPGVKIFVDGAGTPGRGCAYDSFLRPKNITDYWPDIWKTCGTPYGDLYLTEDQLTAVVKDIQNRGYRAAFHAMGDAAIEITLNAIEKALDGQPNSIFRHQIQHNSLIRLELLERYEKLDILASVRGAFNTCEADWYEAVFGQDYYAWNANRYALANMNVHAYSEGDFSRGDINDITRVNPLNPIRSLYGFVTHQQVRADGSVCKPPEWLTRFKISVERALEMLTIEPAYAVSMENYIGSLKPGKFADLIILSDDPLTIDPNLLGDLKVQMTMVNGTIKYCAAGMEAYCLKTIEKGVAELPLPTSTPQIAQVKFDCDKREGSPVHIGKQEFLQTYIRWAAATVEQVNDYLDAASEAIFINGQPKNSKASYGTVEKVEGKNLFFAQSTFDIGVLEPGEYEIQTVQVFNKKIYDGLDYYGPETQNSKIESTCTVIIE